MTHSAFMVNITDEKNVNRAMDGATVAHCMLIQHLCTQGCVLQNTPEFTEKKRLNQLLKYIIISVQTKMLRDIWQSSTGLMENKTSEPSAFPPLSLRYGYQLLLKSMEFCTDG